MAIDEYGKRSHARGALGVPGVGTTPTGSGGVLITSLSNELVKRIRRVRDSKRARSNSGLAYVEGAQVVTRALDAGVHVEALLVGEAVPKHPYLPGLVSRVEAGGAVVRIAAEDVLRSLTDRDVPPQVLGLVRVAGKELSDVVVETDSMFVALEEVANEGNLGTILRTMDSFGSKTLFLVGSTADVWSPAAIKASMGSIFSVDIVRLPDLPTLLQWCRTGSVTIYGTSARGSTLLHSVRLQRPSTLLMGNEGRGLGAAARSACDALLKIPMVGSASSLNLAIATSIMLYEAERQRLEH